MGLGKTLQSICILASDHHERSMKYAVSQSPDSTPCPSLVVCPPTLTAHWYHEIINYTGVLKPLLYAGGPKERERYAAVELVGGRTHLTKEMLYMVAPDILVVQASTYYEGL
jgi:SNF2 family DNA or RNA helicase